MNLGLVFEQSDGVLIIVFLILVVMSIMTWSIIIIRTLALYKAKKSNQQACDLIWESENLSQAQEKVSKFDSPVSELTIKAIKAKQKYNNNKTANLDAAIPLNEYLVRHLRNNMSQILNRFDSGLTILASIGATAPFIGLFGTVWGIYNALINISVTGQMSIAAVSGPIGEALVATAAGLFAAIPAVLAYNLLMRGKKILSQNLDSFTHDLHAQLIHGKD